MTLSKKILVAAAAALAVWGSLTYPKIGELTYRGSAAIESRLYGLHKEVVVVDGTPITLYRSSSTGPVILMIHGFSADKTVWLRFARHFTDRYQVIIPDLPGHGETGYDPKLNYGVAAQSARLVKLLDQLGIAKAHVIGNSMGGNIAAQMALTAPEHVLSLGLCDAAGFIGDHPSPLQKELEQGRNPFLVRTREDFRHFYPMTMAEPPFVPGYVLDAIADQYIARRDQLATIFAQIRVNTDLQTHSTQIKQPVLLMWGQEDQLLDVSNVVAWRHAIPQASSVIWPGVGHMPMLERPAQSAQAYDDFLKGLPGGQIR